MTPERKALKNILKAWESLPGNHNYSAEVIQSWLMIDMKPAIDRARKVI